MNGPCDNFAWFCFYDTGPKKRCSFWSLKLVRTVVFKRPGINNENMKTNNFLCVYKRYKLWVLEARWFPCLILPTFKLLGERGRINESRLQEAVSSLDRNRLICYICGPPPMIQQITEILYKMGIEESRILFEKWW